MITPFEKSNTNTEGAFYIPTPILYQEITHSSSWPFNFLWTPPPCYFSLRRAVRAIESNGQVVFRFSHRLLENKPDSLHFLCGFFFFIFFFFSFSLAFVLLPWPAFYHGRLDSFFISPDSEMTGWHDPVACTLFFFSFNRPM